MLADLREEETGFMFQSLTNGNQSNLIVALGVHQRYDDALEKTKGNVSRLAIVFACVLHGNERPLKDWRGITKVDAMFGEIGLSFGFIPREHQFSVATLCRYVKTAAAAARAG